MTVGGAESIESAFGLAAACYGPRVEPIEWWRWYLLGCPATVSRVVFARRGGRVVGMQPLMLTQFRKGTTNLEGAVLCGGMVHPDCRRQGLFRTLVSAALDEAWRLGADFSLTMPNDRSYPAFLKLGWRDLGERSLLVAPLFGSSRNRRGGDGYRVGLVAQLGTDAVTLCRGLAEQAGTLSHEQSGDWLAWRFDGNPLAEYLKVECRGSSGRLAGIAVGRIVRRGLMRIGVIVEMVSEPGLPERRLVAGLVRELRRQGARLVATVMTPGEGARRLSSLGFRRVPRFLAPKRFFTVWHPGPDASKSRAVPELVSDWHLTLADWDGI